MRALALLLLLPLLLPLAGCGDEAIGLRLDVETFSFDGPLPSDLRIRQVARDGSRGPAYALRPVPDGPSGAFHAPDAPDGAYVLEGPEGWWGLQEGGRPVALQRGLQPPVVSLGRGTSVYVGAESADVRPSDVWGAQRRVANGPPEPVPVTVEVDARGYVVAVRFRPETWRGTLEVMGRIVRGGSSSRPSGPDAPLSEVIRFEAPADGRAYAVRIREEPSEPLQVVPVPATAVGDVEGLRIRAWYDDLPIPAELDVLVRHGLARFQSVPVLDRPLRLQVGDETLPHVVAPEVRRRVASFRLLTLGDVAAVRCRILAGPGVDRVLARPAGVVAFARVPYEEQPEGVDCRLPTGRVDLLVRRGVRWATASATVQEGSTIRVPDASFAEQVAVGGTVDAGGPAHVVRFFRQVADGTEAVLGDGWEVRVEPGGMFEALLPTGRYRVEVHGVRGTWTRPAPLIAESPGARLYVPLESP